MSDADWLVRGVILAIHERQLAEHGGAAGIRDEGLLDSALARPRHRAAYEAADLFDLAAAYGFGLISNHPFVDGNKRTAFVATRLFLLLNGITLTAPKAARFEMFQALAAGQVSEPELAAWLRQNSAPDRTGDGGQSSSE